MTKMFSLLEFIAELPAIARDFEATGPKIVERAAEMIEKRAKAKIGKHRFVRKDAAFRNWITADGSAGPSGIGGFKAEAGRYHLYVSLACPWAHRTLRTRSVSKTI